MLDVLWGTVLVPALVAAFLLVAASRATRRGLPATGALLAGLALAGGHLASVLAIAGSPAWPPVDARSWLFALVPTSTLVAASAVLVGRRSFTLVTRISWAVLVPPLVLAPLARHAWGPWQASLMFALLAATLVLLAEAFERIGTAVRPSAFLAAGAGPAALAVPLLVFGASALFGQLAGALAWALTPLFLGSVVSREPGWWRGLPLPLATVVVLMLGTGAFFAELPLPAAGLLASGPLLAALAARRLARRLGPKGAWIACVALALLPALAGIAVAWVSYEPPGAYGY